MSGNGLEVLDVEEQLEAWDQRVTDPRGVIPTGIPEVDRLLRKGGLAPTNFCILGGVTGTRKTTGAINIARNMLETGHSVAIVGLDESSPNYVAKMCSAITGVNDEYIEDVWETAEGEEFRDAYRKVAERFFLARGRRPTIEHLSSVLDMADHRPEVVFIDYISILGRNKYDGAEIQRVSRLIENLQVWTNDEEIVCIALHQVGRMDEGVGSRYHGDTPMTKRALKFGGEEIADIIFATYRPANNPLGNMRWEDAEQVLPKKTKYYDPYEAWSDAAARVKKYARSTFLQTLKNRPDTKGRCDFEGVELISPDDSLQMTSASTGFDPETMERTAA